MFCKSLNGKSRLIFSDNGSTKGFDMDKRKAFTLIELLVVIAEEFYPDLDNVRG